MKNKFRKAGYVIVMLVWVVSLIFCICKITQIVRNKYQSYESSKKLEKLQEEKKISKVTQKEEQKEETHNNVPKDVSEEVVEEQKILTEYEEMYNQNNDLYGWIEIENTEMNYPVMYTPEEQNFYVNKDFDKKESKKGSIYVSGLCQPDNENLILYGHNCADLSMFGLLSCYKEKAYYENHPTIIFDTIYEKGIYEIISVSKAYIKEEDLMALEEESNIPFYKVKDDDYLFYKHMYLNNEKEFKEYVSNMKDNSYYQINTSAEYGDKLITLCTCTNINKYQNERLLVVAKKIIK